METIRNYLDTMFINFPRSLEMMKLKEDLLATMEEKYAELKAAGKSENEAIGIVISEFGNIDELMHELGISNEEDVSSDRILLEHEAEEYLEAKKKTGFLVGLGVAMILMGAALLISITSLLSNGWLGMGGLGGSATALGLVAMFAFVVPAIGLFVYSGNKMEQYRFLAEGFTMPHSLRASVEERRRHFSKSYSLALVFGVCLCVCSPGLLFLSMLIFGASTYGVAAMLVTLAFAIFMLVYIGNIKESFSVLLKTEDCKPEKEEDRVIGATAAIIWPLAAAGFLVSGFVFNLWHIAWIIFPITGILFGAFSGAYNILKGKDA